MAAVVGGEESDRLSSKGDGLDLEDWSSEKFRIEATPEVAAAVVEAEEEDVAVVALKHFWHMLLVAGFPVTPQLLTQSVKVSGTTLNSVSSFSVLWAMFFSLLGCNKTME